jgi:hypothetical protein
MRLSPLLSLILLAHCSYEFGNPPPAVPMPDRAVPSPGWTPPDPTRTDRT